MEKIYAIDIETGKGHEVESITLEDYPDSIFEKYEYALKVIDRLNKYTPYFLALEVDKFLKTGDIEAAKHIIGKEEECGK